MGKHFLEDQDLANLQALHELAQAKAAEARLAQLAVDTFIRLQAARAGLDPAGRYAVSPRGELTASGDAGPDAGTSPPSNSTADESFAPASALKENPQ